MDLTDRFSETKVYETNTLIGGGDKREPQKKNHGSNENWRKLYVELKEEYKALKMENKRLENEIKKLQNKI